MCHDVDARPPGLPASLRLRPLEGGAVDTRELVLTASDGATFRAFAARSAEPRRTGVVIFPDFRGLGTFYEELAMRFAEAGYDAIAFDYFGRTAGTAPHPADFDAQEHRKRLTPEIVAADAAAAAGYLRSPDGGGDRVVAAVGFCFGGRNALFQAVPDSSVSPAAVVAFYGVLGPDQGGRPGPLDMADRFFRPVLGLYGGSDQAIPVEQVRQLDETLTAGGVPHEIHVYPNAPHSFFDRKHEQFAAEADDAWKRVLAFLGTSAAPPAAD